MAHSIIRMDSCFEKLQSVKFYSGADTTAIDNGHVVKLDSLLTGEREVFKAVAPTALTDSILITAGVELNYDESSLTKNALSAYENIAGKPFRAFVPEVGKYFSVSDDALVKIGSTSVVGNYVIVKVNTTTLEEKASLGGTERFVGMIVAKETLGTATMAVIRVEKC